MMELLESLLSFPVVMFTVPLGLSVIYWLFVIAGAVDIDAFGLDSAAEGLFEGAAEGVAEGLVEGAAEGVAEGLAEGAAEGLAEGAAEGLAEGAAEGAVEGGAGLLMGLLSWLKLRSAPATVVLTLFAIWGFLLSALSVQFLAPIFGTVPNFLIGSVIFLASFVTALLATSVSIRPLAPVFVQQRHRGAEHLVGQTVKIKTSTIDDRMGQANYDDGGSGLQLEVRCKAGRLKRGDEALILEHDKKRGIYWVEPMQALLTTNASSTAIVPQQSATPVATPVATKAEGS